MRITCCCIFSSLFLANCQKELIIHLPEHLSMLTANSFFTKDSIILYLTKSNPIYDKLEHHTIQNAKIFVKSDVSIVDSLSLNNSCYISKSQLLPDITYQIEISVEGFNQLMAEDYLPALVKMDSLIFYPGIGIDEEGYEYSEIDIFFTDPQPIKNYYEISLVYLYVDPFSGLKSYGIGCILSEDIIIENEGNNAFDYCNILFSDEMINGKAYKLKCKKYHHDYESQYFIHFRSVSENYYKYKKSLMRHFANQEGDVWSGTGNPVDLYSNIQGGYGIFAGYQEDVDTIFVNK